MRFSNVATAALVAPLVAAHGGVPGAPKLFGLPRHLQDELKAPVAARTLRHSSEPRHGLLETRQGGQNGRCGPSFANAKCAAGYCCSGAGYCGTSKDHCSAPDCLIDFGPACDANKTPSGASTRNDARPQKGNVPYGGEGIYVCQKPGTVAITYDDGPYIYTDRVLDQFKQYGFKATFFVTGINIGKGAIDTTTQWANVIKRMVAEGHQVASHTWSHQDLSVITEEQRYDQMVKNEMAIRNIIGKYPTYMRPPYSSCNAACQGVMKKLGYVISYFDLDTDDYNQLKNIQVAKDNFKRILDSTAGGPTTGDRLAIAHDIHEQTALNLTGYMLEYLKSKGYRGVTMGECMGEPEANWYRKTGETVTPPSNGGGNTGGTPISTDGQCGSGKGTCAGSAFGNCCSSFGWCGSTDGHCKTGCNSAFGTCTGGSTSPSTPVSTDGQCGAKGFGATCQGSSFGNCCSQFGWCGSSQDHCGAGCDKTSGTCN
ncbi:carbohydrate esterase family 4 protein [Bipolaris oryzae ATCC 44560]|uniref:Carbohydrate esterase family 4 protein n=1 Tax=Bipolaris oryzae ATCC 44560 TaxID=930090 RepID=W6YU10_COCMI|nr:carbohydrate esterase family 4 protein [Bipolaris oryzae ATCC 44560]EUC42947.1 carbohydrate esterase family 4 protein [Bipolaris oryzae ATCC 44560]